VKPATPVRIAALICVAVTSIFLMYMNWKIVNILASPDWCSKALQAEKISTQNFGGLTACVDLLTIQLKSLSTNSQIQNGVIALSLLVLIVIVIAGGKLDFSWGKDGASASMSKETPATEAAKRTATAAVDEAKTIIKEAAPPAAPTDEDPRP
jgi:hypothetical protein